jgi:hypothetical protein
MVTEKTEDGQTGTKLIAFFLGFWLTPKNVAVTLLMFVVADSLSRVAS